MIDCKLYDRTSDICLRTSGCGIDCPLRNDVKRSPYAYQPSDPIYGKTHKSYID